jgi:GR25 family glycosyltransferase involved in LPS biosynthesis
VKCVIIHNPEDELSVRLMNDSIASCNLFGISPEPFAGTFKDSIDEKIEQYKLVPSTHKLEPKNGERGCFISHYEVWLQCINENQNYMILEHDVIMKRSLPENILDQFDGILNLDPCGANQKDLEKYIECSISKSENSVDRLPTPVGALTWKTAKQYHVPGAYAYIIKPTAAEQLVKHARSSGYLPVDVHINSYYVSIRTVTPSIFKICDFMLDRKNRVKYSSTKGG